MYWYTNIIKSKKTIELFKLFSSVENVFGCVLMCGTVFYDSRHEMVQNQHSILYYNHH